MINPSAFSSLFGTQANTDQNSFSNPLNSANTNAGWGIDPSLLTPSYEANYRPQYAGAQPYGAYGRPSMMRSLGEIQFGQAQRFGNNIDNDRQYVESASSKPFDSIVWAGQHTAIPAVAYGGSFLALSGIGNQFGKGVGKGLARGFTGSFGGVFNNPVGRLAAGGFESMMGGVGSIVGGFGLPIMAAQAAMSGMQTGLVNPYINTRRQARDLRDNFQGVTFSDARGNSVTGQGLGGQESSRMASALTNQGIKDYTFSAGEYSNISDYSARSGLLDDSKAKQITQHVKDIAEQVKLIMALGKDPSIQNAVEELSKLHLAGASIVGGNSSAAAQTYSKMSQYASIAGRSVQNVMNTVGAQGQYLYQANGMTPYLGQLAAGNILGAMESARRQGILTTSQVARMGGTEGGTQASLTGQLAVAQTPFAKMQLLNQLHNGSGNNTVTGAIGAYGQRMSNDSIGAMGEDIVLSRQLAGKAITEQGSRFTENQSTRILDMLPTKKNANGQYSVYQLATALKFQGMNDDQISSFINQRVSETDPEAYAQREKAMNVDTMKSRRAYASQHALTGDMTGRFRRGIGDFGRGVTGTMGAVGEKFAEVSGMANDQVNRYDEWMSYGGSFGKGSMISNMDDFVNSQKVQKDQTVKLLDNSGLSGGGGLGLDDIGRGLHSLYNGTVLNRGQSYEMIDKINDLAKTGDKYATAFTAAKSKEERSKALGELLANRKDSLGQYASKLNDADGDTGNFSEFLKITGSEGQVDYTTKGEDQRTGYQNVLDRVTGGKMDMLDSLNTIGQADSLAEDDTVNEGTIEGKLKDKKYANISGLLSKLSNAEKVQRIRQIYTSATKEGVDAIGSLSYGTDSNLEAYKKDPSRIQDKKLRAQFQAAKTDEERKRIITSDVAYRAGGVLQTEGLKTAGSATRDELIGYNQAEKIHTELSAKNYAAFSAGKYDYATFQSTQNSLDSKKSMDDFGKHVQDFGEAVKAMPGAKDDSPTPTYSFMHGLFSGDKKPADNKRDGGGALPK